MSRVVVIGAGAMGLAAAYRAVMNGHEVELFEAAPDAGGMAGHFDFDGISIERFYHFVCMSDHPTFELLDQLGLSDKMIWRKTTMGFFYRNRINAWGDPVALLKLPGVGLLDKLRYAVFACVCVRRNKWDAIEHESARNWLLRWCGKANYERFWQPLLEFKFYEYAHNVSATWIWTRIRRIGNSRKSLFEERLGYIDGGSMTLVNALVDAIQKKGGKISLGEPAQQITAEDGRVTGVETTNGHHPADAVICTIPTPLVSRLVPALPQDWKDRYDAIHNIGVICVIFRLTRSVSPHFWVNISDKDLDIPGVIEFSNLRSVGNESIVYVPYYMPVTRPKFSWSDAQLISDAFSCLQRLNRTMVADDIVATKVARLRYGQPICEPGFAEKIPPVQTPIKGLQIADTCFYYPEDRGIAESVRLGAAMAQNLPAQSV